MEIELTGNVLQTLGASEGQAFEGERLLRTAVVKAQLLRLALRGVTPAQAAPLVKLNVQTVRRYYADPEFKRAALGKLESALGSSDEAFASRRLTLHEKIEAQAEQSFDDLVSMLQDGELPIHLRMKINQDFLDRSADSQKQVTTTHRFDSGQLVTAAQAAREMDARVVTIKGEKVA